MIYVCIYIYIYIYITFIPRRTRTGGQRDSVATVNSCAQDEDEDI